MKYIKLFENIDWDWMDEEESDMPDEFDDNKDFYKFLDDNNALDKFIYNLKESGKNLKNYLKIRYGSELIDLSFTWDETPEGYDYWSDLDYSWRNIIYNK